MICPGETVQAGEFNGRELESVLEDKPGEFSPEGNDVMKDETEDIRLRCHRVCREYLNGSWARVSPEQIIISKISGGLSNLLYLAELPADCPPCGPEPRRVLLRLYGQLHVGRALEGLVTEAVIFTLLSESHRGPRLFGVFPGGRLEEYIPARPLLTRELSDPVLSCVIAEKMAQIHMMNVPINKEPTWLWQTTGRWLDMIDKFSSQPEVPPEHMDMVKKVASYRLRSEMNWLKRFLISVASPVVFCHNDIQEGNILLRENTSSASQVVIIDFEYCSYNYRGFDFANHMCEWMYDYTNEDPPFFWEKSENYPTREQQEMFIKSYLDAMQKESQIPKDTSRNSEEEVDRLIWEIQAFTLASHFFWALWSIVNASISKIAFDYWGYGEARLDAYFKHKNKLFYEIKDMQV